MLWVCRIECTLLHGIQNHVPDGIMYVKVSCIMLLYLSTYMVSCIMYKSKNAKYPVSSTYVHGILYYVYMQSILYNVPYSILYHVATWYPAGVSLIKALCPAVGIQVVPRRGHAWLAFLTNHHNHAARPRITSPRPLAPSSPPHPPTPYNIHPPPLLPPTPSTVS